MRYRTANLGEVLDEYLTDDRLKAALTAPWSYLGLPPSKLSFLLFTQMVNVMVRGASHSWGAPADGRRPRSSPSPGTGASWSASTPVTKIVIEDGKVAGSGPATTPPRRSSSRAPTARTRCRPDRRRTPHAPGRPAAGAAEAVDLLVPLTPAPGWTWPRRARRTRTCCSTTGRTTTPTPTSIAGRRGGMSLDRPHALRPVARPARPPRGRHPRAGAVRRRLAGAQGALHGALLAVCDELFPGFGDSLDFVEASTPLTLERFTRNHRGAAFGWANSPTQAGNRRLPHELGIAGCTWPATGRRRGDRLAARAAARPRPSRTRSLESPAPIT